MEGTGAPGFDDVDELEFVGVAQLEHVLLVLAEALHLLQEASHGFSDPHPQFLCDGCFCLTLGDIALGYVHSDLF